MSVIRNKRILRNDDGLYFIVPAQVPFIHGVITTTKHDVSKNRPYVIMSWREPISGEWYLDTFQSGRIVALKAVNSFTEKRIIVIPHENTFHSNSGSN